MWDDINNRHRSGEESETESSMTCAREGRTKRERVPQQTEQSVPEDPGGRDARMWFEGACEIWMHAMWIARGDQKIDMDRQHSRVHPMGVTQGALH